MHTHVYLFGLTSIVGIIIVFDFGWWRPVEMSPINPFQSVWKFVAEVIRPAECQILSNVTDTVFVSGLMTFV